MKLRESGLTQKAYGESLFNFPLILDGFEDEARLKDAIKWGCSSRTPETELRITLAILEKESR